MAFKHGIYTFQSPSSMGNQDISHGLGALDNDVVIILHYALEAALTTTSMGANNLGYATGYTHYNGSAFTRNTHGVGLQSGVNGGDRQFNSIIGLDANGNTIEAGDVTVVDSTKIRINWTTVSTSNLYYSMTILSGVKAAVGQAVTNGNHNGDRDITHGLGKKPGLCLFAGVHSTIDGYYFNGACDGDLNQRSASIKSASSGSATASVFSNVYAIQAGNNTASFEFRAEVTTIDATKVTLTSRQATSTDFIYCIITDVGVEVGDFVTNDAYFGSNTQVTGLAFTPKILQFFGIGAGSGANYLSRLGYSLGWDSAQDLGVNMSASEYNQSVENIAIKADTDNDGVPEYRGQISFNDIITNGFRFTEYVGYQENNIRFAYVAITDAITKTQSLVGSSTNSGEVTVSLIIAQALSGTSSNSGNLSTHLFEVVSQAVSGVTTNLGNLASDVFRTISLSGTGANAGILSKTIHKILPSAISSGGDISTQTIFNGKWSVEHLESRTDYGFPTVWVEVNSEMEPSGSFATGELYERRLLEMPRLEEAELSSRFGIAGFQKLSLRVDNSDGLLNGIDLQDSYVRMFFLDENGTDYREFNGRVVDWTLSHECIVNVEDMDALAITQDLPSRTLNELVEAEKAADGTFENYVIADDLGSPIPVIFGRAVKVPILYVKANEDDREYDYIIGEGEGLGGGNLQEVFTVYRNEQALDSIEGDVASATSITLTLESADKRPDSWYKYWWVEITAGTGAGQIKDVTGYDSANNRITVSSAWSTTPNSSSDYRLREWRFFDGSQASPYEGYAYIRFKKRMGTSGRTDPIYADVNGFTTEANPVRTIQSILSSSTWGLGLTVDTANFDTAAAMSGVSDMLCEGALLDTTSAIDVLNELLAFRDMVLSKADAILISVDQTKTSSFNSGLGDETGWNNILNPSPAISHIHPSEKVKNLKVKYRKNNQESDLFQYELERAANSNGVDTVINLPFVYDHQTADRWLDYKRKRFAATKRLSIDVGQEGPSVTRGDRVTVSVPTLGLTGSDWEVTGVNVTPTGPNTLSLVPYSADPYTYVPITSEGGSLPADESFDIAPDYSSTVPDPVTGLVATASTYTSPTGDILGRLDISWTPPNDPPYEGAEVFVKKTSEGESAYKSRGIAYNNMRVEGLENNTAYDVKVLSVNGELRGLAAENTNKTVGTSLPTPSTPSTPSASRFGRHWRFTVTPNSSSEKISHYVWQIATSAGSLQDTVDNAGTEINWNVSGTSTVSYKARVKAVNIYGQESGYSNYSSALSNERWQTGHFENDSVTNAIIGNAAVDTAQIANLAVEEGKIGSLAVTSAKIGNLQVTNLKIDDDSVDENKRIDVYNSFTGISLGTIDINRKATGTYTHGHSLGRRPMVSLRFSAPSVNSEIRLIHSCTLDGVGSTSFTARWQVGNFGGSGSLAAGTATLEWWYW